jgi:uncharacterized membrane protein
MTKKIASTVLLTLAVAILLHGSARRAPAHDGCSNATLEGTYGVQFTGTLTAGPSAGPIAGISIITFDGNGQFTLLQTQRLLIAGIATTVKVPFTGTYSVNPDCTQSSVLTNTLTGAISTSEGVIVDHGRGFFALNTTAGAPAVTTAVGRKQFPGNSDSDQH